MKLPKGLSLKDGTDLVWYKSPCNISNLNGFVAQKSTGKGIWYNGVCNDYKHFTKWQDAGIDTLNKIELWHPEMALHCAMYRAIVREWKE